MRLDGIPQRPRGLLLLTMCQQQVTAREIQLRCISLHFPTG